MRFIAVDLFLAVVLAIPFACFAAEGALPAPKKTGGAPLFEAIDMRNSASQKEFPAGKVGPEDLSAILWAASGLNRDGSKWTVPMAMGKPPYCKIYVADDDGVTVYDWKTHSLARVTADNVKSEIAMQEFVRNAPQILILVMDSAELAQFKDAQHRNEFGLILVGSMSQNIYLAADALGVGTRFIYSINRDVIARRLGLASEDRAVCVMPIGKK